MRTRHRGAEPELGWTGSPSRTLALSGTPAVALARPSHSVPVTRPRAEQLVVNVGGASSSRPRPRQQSWTDRRPPRPPAGLANDDDNPTATVSASGERRQRRAADRPPVEIPGSRGPGAGAPADPSRGIAVAVPPSGVRCFIGGVGALVVTAIASRFGISDLGVGLIPVAGVLFAVAAARRITRQRPDGALRWGQWLILGVCAKLAASYLRYLTLLVGYKGVGTPPRTTSSAGSSRWPGPARGPIRC